MTKTQEELIEMLIISLEDIRGLETLLSMAQRKKKMVEDRIQKEWRKEFPNGK